jgi:hypothetical protein
VSVTAAALVLPLVFASAALGTDDGPPSTSSSSTSPPLEARPTSEQARNTLAEAEAALRAGLAKKCITFVQRALATGQLDEQQTARAWLVRGRCHVVDRDLERAERAYAVAVRVQPDLVVPDDDAVFERVQPEGSAQGSALTLGAMLVVADPTGVVAEAGEAVAAGAKTGARAGPALAVAVHTQDDLGIVRIVVVVDAEGREIARAPLVRAPDAVGDAFVRPTVTVTVPAGTAASGATASGATVNLADARVRLLDRHGNRLREGAVTVTPQAQAAVAAMQSSSSSSPALASPSSPVSLVGAAAATLGLVAAAAGGIALSTAAQADPERVKDDEGPAFAVFVAGVVLFVGGGAVVTVDQWPR